MVGLCGSGGCDTHWLFGDGAGLRCCAAHMCASQLPCMDSAALHSRWCCADQPWARNSGAATHPSCRVHTHATRLPCMLVPAAQRHELVQGRSVCRPVVLLLLSLAARVFGEGCCLTRAGCVVGECLRAEGVTIWQWQQQQRWWVHTGHEREERSKEGVRVHGLWRACRCEVVLSCQAQRLSWGAHTQAQRASYQFSYTHGWLVCKRPGCVVPDGGVCMRV
jgi:hypothetical protein